MKNDSGTCGIYKITRKDTGQAYIGLSENIERRYRAHANGNGAKSSRIDRAMVKHGEDKFDLEIIEELPNDRDLLMEREAYWVAHYNTYENDFHYNLTPGGDFSPMKVPEIAAKISGENSPAKNPEVRAKMSKAKSGKNHPFFGKFGEESPAFGRKHTAEAKEKISKACKGKKCSKDTIKKMSKARNTTGFLRVCKQKSPTCKQGFTYTYQYLGEDKKRHTITSVSLEKLEQKVKDKGLPWFKLNDNDNNKYLND